MTWTNAVPGTLQVHVDELDEHAPPNSKWRDALDRISVTLAALREKLGGDYGAITAEFGESHEISLARWAGRDPETRLLVWFSYQQRDAPAGFRGSIYPPDILTRAHPAAPPPEPTA
jgi:hypothetical protein